MKNKFIYSPTKSLFEKKLAAGEIGEGSIVFIEDTKEIWNRGHYFGMVGSGSGIDPEVLSGIETAIATLQSDKADKSELSDYALKSELPSLDGYLTKTVADSLYATIAQYNTLSQTVGDIQTELSNKLTSTDLEGYAKTTDIPTKISDLNDDSEFITNAEATAAYAPKSLVETVSDQATTISTLATKNELSTGLAGKLDNSAADGFVPKTRKVNGVALDQDITITATDPNAATKEELSNVNTDLQTFKNNVALTYATDQDVADAVAALVDSSPTTLDTLNELAAALGDDPNFATTVATNIGKKADQSALDTTNTNVANLTTKVNGNSVSKSGETLTVSINGSTQSLTNTDTKVTSAANHYTPSADSNSQLSVDASSSTAASWNSTSLVTGVNIQRDSKGHVTGVTVDSIKMPANPNTDTNTHYTTRIYAGASGTAANAAASNPYVKITDDNTYRNQIQIKGGGATTVSSDANGVITISSTDTNTNTWRGITDSVSTTDSTISGSATAVKTAYDKAVSAYNLANGKTSNTGTVTSVAMTVPTGLSISGSPITTSGTLALSLASGYSIPTTATQSNWNTAYGWGDHASAGYLKYGTTMKRMSDASNLSITVNMLSTGKSLSVYIPSTAYGTIILPTPTSAIDGAIVRIFNSRSGANNAGAKLNFNAAQLFFWSPSKGYAASIQNSVTNFNLNSGFFEAKAVYVPAVFVGWIIFGHLLE